jgi:hypothetical protein
MSTTAVSVCAARSGGRSDETGAGASGALNLEDHVFGGSIPRSTTAAILLWSTHAAADLGADGVSPPNLAVMVAAMLRHPVLELLLDEANLANVASGPIAFPWEAAGKPSQAKVCRDLAALWATRDTSLVVLYCEHLLFLLFCDGDATLGDAGLVQRYCRRCSVLRGSPFEAFARAVVSSAAVNGNFEALGAILCAAWEGQTRGSTQSLRLVSAVGSRIIESPFEHAAAVDRIVAFYESLPTRDDSTLRADMGKAVSTAAAARRRTCVQGPHVGDIRALCSEYLHGRRDVLGLLRRLLAFQAATGSMRLIVQCLSRTRQADLAALVVALALSSDATATTGFDFRDVIADVFRKEVQDRLADHGAKDTTPCRSRRPRLTYANLSHGSQATPLLSVFDARDNGSPVLRSAGDARAAAHFGSDPHVFLASFYRPPPAGAPATADRATFLRRWSALTGGLLDGWDWSATVAVGGAVTHCLCPDEDANRPRPPDVDLFFVGGTASVVEWSERLCTHIVGRVGAGNVGVVLSTTALSFIFADPYLPRVQAALGRWRCVADVLQTTDLDCSAVGYVGNGHVVCTGRGALAWVHRLNTPSETQHRVRNSPEYELRLWKYAVRFGFGVFLRKHRSSVVSKITSESLLGDEVGLRWMLLVDRHEIVPCLRPDQLTLAQNESLAAAMQRLSGVHVGDGYRGSNATWYSWLPTSDWCSTTATSAELHEVGRMIDDRFMSTVDGDEWIPVVQGERVWSLLDVRDRRF